MPTTAFPGIGATTRTLTASITSAKSSWRLTILLTFTPAAGANSYMVITGPGNTCTTSPSTPNSRSFCSRNRAWIANSSELCPRWSVAGVSSRSSDGSASVTRCWGRRLTEGGVTRPTWGFCTAAASGWTGSSGAWHTDGSRLSAWLFAALMTGDVAAGKVGTIGTPSWRFDTVVADGWTGGTAAWLADGARESA